MTEKTLGEQLWAVEENKRKKAAERARKDKVAHAAEVKKEVEYLYEETVASLPERLKVASEQGKTRLEVWEKSELENYRDLSEVQLAVMYKIKWNWLRQNGFHDHFSNGVRKWDYDSPDYYAICWEKH